MPKLQPGQTLLDACAVVNIYATRRIDDILVSIPGRVSVADVVEREAQYVLRGGTGDDARERDPIILQPYLDQGILTVVEANEDDELLTFVDLTLELDDGEAMTAALAIHRGYIVVTDDGKAARVLAENQVVVRSTLEVVQDWANLQAIPALELQNVLIDLRDRGRYLPANHHPLKNWWDNAIDPTNPTPQ